MFFSLCLVLFLTLSPAYGGVFKWIDNQGQTHFSDKPKPGAKSLRLNSGYSYYRVKKVYDGDTILLTNGSKVRFLGINTPEVGGRQKQAQAGGEEAKRWLIQKIGQQKVRLESDVEKKDKYGRLLAHVFTEDKEHLNLQLVQRGLASVNIYPPNLKYSEALMKAEQQAEQFGRGIWRYVDYQPKAVSEIRSGRYSGWQRIRGTVISVRHSGKYRYLNLSDNFALKIDNKAMNYFPSLDSYRGQKIEARGWINRHKDKYSMFIRHSSAIKIR